MYLVVKKNISRDLNEAKKIIRTGKIIAVNKTVAYKTRLTTIEITLEDEPVPVGFPEIHRFDIYNSFGQLYHQQDYNLKKDYEKLNGKQIELSYFPYSGIILSVKLID